MNRVGNLARGVAKTARPTVPMGEWADQAACIGLDPDLFHPQRGVSLDPAKTVCATCPVRTDCLDYALKTNQVLFR